MAEHRAECPRCGHLLEVDAASGERVVCPNCQTLVSPDGKPGRSERLDPLVGQKLGEFEIVELIGRGAMGAVYRARQRLLDRFVAIKILLPSLAENEDLVKRFYREARSAANLRHSSIVQVHAVGESQGRHYIAMEWVDGEGLDAILRREGPLAQERALQIFKEVSSALAAAHEAGIIHRDIKTSNILIDSKGLARVTDFGLAKRLEGDIAVTATGQSLGTPLFMPPEVSSGKKAEPRSDLYSLGATMFYLLAGRPPFEGETATEIIIKSATQKPPALAAVAPHADRRLARIIDRLLSKDPRRRHPSARALLEELEALGPLQSPAAPAGVEARAELAEAPTRVRKRPGAAIVAAAVGAVLLVAIVVVAWVTTRRRPRQQAGDGKAGASTAVDAGKPDAGHAARERAVESEWVSLFDGKTLEGWMVPEDFPGPWGGKAGEVRVANGQIILEPGDPWTGIIWTGEFPAVDYEVELDVMRAEGQSTFCCMVFPMGGPRATLDIGGWGGNVVGLAGLDGKHANDNITTTRIDFQNGQWYRMRLRVTQARVELWIDQEKVIDLATAGHRLATLTVLRAAKRFGIFSSRTRAALGAIRLRRLAR